MKLKILHVLANGPPDVNGYAVRTHGLMKAYSGLPNIEVVGLTSPWYPDRDSMAEPIEMDGVTYHRCLHPARMKSVKGPAMKWSASKGKDRIAGTAGFASKPLYKRALSLLFKPLRPGWAWLEEKIIFKHFTSRIIEVAKEENAEIIHAHVPYRVGIPALRAARKLSLPFIYEMRGMWEESAVASGRWKSVGLAYRRFRRMETKVLRAADNVICISETLRKEAISRGVDEDKISVVPNAVDAEVVREESDLFHEMKEKLEGKLVVGYIGSLRELEGVDLTAEAVSILKEKGVDVNFFVLSSESGQDNLRAYCHELGISENSHIVGPVPHNKVAPFYDLIDVFVVSRPDTRVTRLVTPLKPFEAMRSGRAVVVADLPALSEIVEDGETGCLYPAGNAQALAETIHDLLQDKSKRDSLGEQAKNWILENRIWGSVVAGNPFLENVHIKHIIADYFHNLKDYDKYKVERMEERVLPNIEKLGIGFTEYVNLFINNANERCEKKSENIFIVNPGSSGSHWLAAMIDEIEDMNTIGEVYFPNKLRDKVNDFTKPNRRLLINAIHLGHLPEFNRSNVFSKIINTGHFSGRVLKFIQESDPDCKCILLVRDPIDIVISRTFRKDEHKQLISPKSSSDEYLLDNIKIVKNWYKNNLKQSFDYKLRYEDLNQDTYSSLISLCKFLDINPEDNQINKIVNEYNKENNPKNTKLFSGPRREITPAQRQLLEDELNDLRASLGYTS